MPLVYPTGQNYSLELMSAKFATNKNREKLNPQAFTPSGALCLTTTEKEKSAHCLGFEFATTRLQDRLQVRCSITEL